MEKQDNFLELVEKSDGTPTFLEDLEMGHSTYQIEQFILGEEQGLTVWSQYKQCMRELYTRISSLRDHKYQLKKAAIELRILERDIGEEKDNLKKEILDLDIERKKEDIMLAEVRGKDIEREGEVFAKAYSKLKKAVNDQLADEHKTKDDLEREYWHKKLAQDMENNVLTQLGPNIALWRILRNTSDKDLRDVMQKALINQRMQSKLDDIVQNQKIQVMFTKGATQRLLTVYFLRQT